MSNLNNQGSLTLFSPSSDAHGIGFKLRFRKQIDDYKYVI